MAVTLGGHPAPIPAAVGHLCSPHSLGLVTSRQPPPKTHLFFSPDQTLPSRVSPGPGMAPWPYGHSSWKATGRKQKRVIWAQVLLLAEAEMCLGGFWSMTESLTAHCPWEATEPQLAGKRQSLPQVWRHRGAFAVSKAPQRTESRPRADTSLAVAAGGPGSSAAR